MKWIVAFFEIVFIIGLIAMLISSPFADWHYSESIPGQAYLVWFIIWLRRGRPTP